MYVVVGFRLEKLKSVYYKVCRNIEEVARVFKVMFEQRDAHFASIRRIPASTGVSPEGIVLCTDGPIKRAGRVVVAPGNGKYKLRVEPYAGNDYDLESPKIEVKTLVVVYDNSGVRESIVADELVLEVKQG